MTNQHYDLLIRNATIIDGTQPNAAGYKAMGEFVDLNLFR